MEVKLVAFDLDGTLLDNSKQISPETLVALAVASVHGAELVPATGRIFDGIPPLLKSLPFIRYYITSNGAEVYDAREDKVLATAEIPVERAVELLEYEDSRPVIYDCYKQNWGYMTDSMLSQAGDYVTDPGIYELVRGLREPVDELKRFLLHYGGGVQKLQVYFKDPEERRQQFEILPERFPDMLFTSSVSFNMEINSINSSKGQALASLCKHLGISSENVMALGDGSNDIDMLRFAGLGVAMGNASDSVKAEADYVTDSNEDNGFAKAIDKFIAGGES